MRYDTIKLLEKNTDAKLDIGFDDSFFESDTKSIKGNTTSGITSN